MSKELDEKLFGEAVGLSRKDWLRLQKLLALTESASEGEALSALQKVRDFLERRDLRIAELLCHLDDARAAVLDDLWIEQARSEMTISALDQTLDQRACEYQTLLEQSRLQQKEMERLELALALEKEASRKHLAKIKCLQMEKERLQKDLCTARADADEGDPYKEKVSVLGSDVMAMPFAPSQGRSDVTESGFQGHSRKNYLLGAVSPDNRQEDSGAFHALDRGKKRSKAQSLDEVIKGLD